MCGTMFSTSSFDIRLINHEITEPLHFILQQICTEISSSNDLCCLPFQVASYSVVCTTQKGISCKIINVSYCICIMGHPISIIAACLSQGSFTSKVSSCLIHLSQQTIIYFNSRHRHHPQFFMDSPSGPQGTLYEPNLFIRRSNLHNFTNYT